MVKVMVKCSTGSTTAAVVKDHGPSASVKPQYLMGPKAPFMPSAGGFSASIYVYIKCVNTHIHTQTYSDYQGSRLEVSSYNTEYRGQNDIAYSASGYIKSIYTKNHIHYLTLLN